MVILIKHSSIALRAVTNTIQVHECKWQSMDMPYSLVNIRHMSPQVYGCTNSPQGGKRQRREEGMFRKYADTYRVIYSFVKLVGQGCFHNGFEIN